MPIDLETITFTPSEHTDAPRLLRRRIQTPCWIRESVALEVALESLIESLSDNSPNLIRSMCERVDVTLASVRELSDDDARRLAATAARLNEVIDHLSNSPHSLDEPRTCPRCVHRQIRTPASHRSRCLTPPIPADLRKDEDTTRRFLFP